MSKSSNTLAVLKVEIPETPEAQHLSSPPLTLKGKTRAADEMFAGLDSAAYPTLFRELGGDGGLADFLSAIMEASPYLRGLCRRFPDILEATAKQGFSATCHTLIKEARAEVSQDADQKKVMKTIRRLKARSALAIALADLGGWWRADMVSQVLTDLADACVGIAVDHLLWSAHDSGKLALPDLDRPQIGSGYCVLAMGKHGAGELNFSSDIDLIVFFDPEAPAIVDPGESVATFVRLTKGLVRILQERTPDGYAFRTDLRLRPDPAAMPIAIPLPLALTYYEARGQNWERAALIKARAIAGDPETGEVVLRDLAPFIWRRYLDYAAIADIHSIKRQIQSHRDLTSIDAAGHNVKLGKGGIREIEFFVQTQQLIAGGRIPTLRARRTLEMLDLLEQHGWIEEKTAGEMSESYLFLRDAEHRLQMMNDAQTHTIPETKADQKSFATLCGSQSFNSLAKHIEQHLLRVEKHYSQLFASETTLSTGTGNLSFAGSDDDPETLEVLSGLGFHRPESVVKTVRRWHYGGLAALQSAEAREALNELTPVLLSKMAESDQPDLILARFDEFLSGLPAGIQLISILNRNHGLLSLLIRILVAAPRLAKHITRRPHVFDGLLEIGYGATLPDGKALRASLARTLDLARSHEDGLDRVRAFVGEQRFLIGARILSGQLAASQAGASYSQLAETALEGIFHWVRKAFEERHGIVPQAEYALVALGNLGSSELTAASDLDLLMLYRYDPANDHSDGEKSLHASQYFGRFTQRLIAALSAPTAEGVAYELDFRLRPHGTDGPIATSLHAFTQYYQNDAWTWERMTLSRARVLLSSRKFAQEVDAAIDRAVKSASASSALETEILDMRKLMDRERAPKGDWDLKLLPGGIVDLEFLSQWAVLKGFVPRGGTTSEKLANLPNCTLPNDNVTLHQVFSSFHGTVQLMRLCLEAPEKSNEWSEGFTDLVLKETGFPDLKTAKAHLDELRQAVRACFLETLARAAD